MRESQVINGWKREGKVEGQVEVARAWVLEAIQVLLEDPVPEVIQLAVEGTNDLNTLRRWYRAALTAGSLADFRAAMSA